MKKREKLVAVRKSKAITQADVATFLKISQTQYQKRESGKIKITDKEWIKIAKLLTVEINDIYEESTALLNEKILHAEICFLKEKINLLEKKLILLHLLNNNRLILFEFKAKIIQQYKLITSELKHSIPQIKAIKAII